MSKVRGGWTITEMNHSDIVVRWINRAEHRDVTLNVHPDLGLSPQDQQKINEMTDNRERLRVLLDEPLQTRPSVSFADEKSYLPQAKETNSNLPHVHCELEDDKGCSCCLSDLFKRFHSGSEAVTLTKYTNRFSDQQNQPKQLNRYTIFHVQNDSMKTLSADVRNFVNQKGRDTRPSFGMTVTGDMSRLDQLTKQSLSESLKKLAKGTNLLILSDGRNGGVSEYIGKLLHSEQTDDKPVLLSVTDWGSMSTDKQELLKKAIKTKKKSKEIDDFLNPYQSAYIFLDNKKTSPSQPDEWKLLNYLLHEMNSNEAQDQKTKIFKGYGEEKMLLITMVIGVNEFTNEFTISHILHSVKNKHHIVVIFDSGKTLPLIAKLYHKLVLESSNDQECETKCDSFITRHNDELKRKFQSTILTSGRTETTVDEKFEQFKKDLKYIMKERKYITMINNMSTEDDSIHQRMLQASFQGCCEYDGLFIALHHENLDFLQALFRHRYKELRPMDKVDLSAKLLYNLHVKNLECEMEAIISKLIGKHHFNFSEDCECVSEDCACADVVVGDDPHVLSKVGKILYKLMGPRYQLLYHKTPTFELSVGKQYAGKKMEELWHFFLLTVLSNKPKGTKFCILQSCSSVGMSLIAFKLYDRLAYLADLVYEEELSKSLRKSSDSFEDLAVDILDNMYNSDREETYNVLVGELPLNLGPTITPLVVADDARALKFMSHAACQTYLQHVWKGEMSYETPFWKSILVVIPFLIIPTIHFNKQPTKKDISDKNLPTTKTYRKSVGKDAQPDAPRKTLCDTRWLCSWFSSFWDHPITWKIRCYYAAPVTNFYMRMMSYILFLTLLSYFVLTDLKPYQGSVTTIKWTEWLLIAWIISHIMEEFAQFIQTRDTGPMFEISTRSLSSSTWRWYERLALNLYKLQIYIQEGWWNSIDLIIMILFIICFSLRFSNIPNMFQLVRIFFAVTIIICFFKLLSFWYVLKSMGPRIIAIESMLTELMKFLLLLAVFIISFGIAFQAILEPNTVPSFHTFGEILRRPYWQMFGELFLNDQSSCEIRQNSTESVIPYENCFTWVPPVLLGVYLLIANVLLLNLLVAIFSQAYDDVKKESDKLWMYKLYNLIEEFYFLESLPPPLNIMGYTVQLIKWMISGFQGPEERRRSTDKFLRSIRSHSISMEKGKKLQHKACQELENMKKSSKQKLLIKIIKHFKKHYSKKDFEKEFSED